VLFGLRPLRTLAAILDLQWVQTEADCQFIQLARSRISNVKPGEVAGYRRHARPFYSGRRLERATAQLSVLRKGRSGSGVCIRDHAIPRDSDSLPGFMERGFCGRSAIS